MTKRRVKCKNGRQYKKALLKDMNFLELNNAKINKQVINISQNDYDELMAVIA